MHRRSFLAVASLLTTPALAKPALAQPARVLKFVPEADLAVLDPIWTTSSQTTQHAFLVYDTLFGLDSAFRPQPQMLDSFMVSEGGRSWQLVLREGLAFHDGSAVLARDCVASINRWGKRDPFGQALISASDEISASDDRTIVLRMKYPFPVATALGKSTANVCVIMPERLATTDAFRQVSEVIGSGPFRFKGDERIPGARVVYERNAAYRPREDGVVSGSAGPKVVYFDRVEWSIMPDAATAASAIQTGEIDWLLTPNADLVDGLSRRKDVSIRVLVAAGAVSCMRFNQLQLPFNNPALRRALLLAINQQDYMVAVNGDNRSRWHDGVGYFTPGTPMANAAGMDALTGPRSVDAAKRALADGGYNNERVVLLGPADVPYAKILADVTADLFKRVGLNLDYQVMDWGTLVQRRAKTEPVDQGGWSVFQTNWPGPDQANPAAHVFLRANGRDAAPGWPSSQRLEALRADWLQTDDPAEQQRIAQRMQLQAFQDVPYIPLGQTISPSALRADLQHVVEGQAVFWNIRRG
ncbi:MAG: ABC transporter substrate-binding protein [Janthinobacterium lividum]